MGMGISAIGILVITAVVCGAVAQFVGKRSLAYDWLYVGVAGLAGGLFGQYVGLLERWGPHYKGLQVTPAVIGVVVVAFAVAGLARMMRPATA